MKLPIFFYLFFSLASCKPVESVESGGMYTCRYKNEFAKTNDTLLLQKIKGNFFSITRHSGLVKTADNNRQHLSEIWKLEYDPGKKIFIEMRWGRVLLWKPENHVLIFGNREYVNKKN